MKDSKLAGQDTNTVRGRALEGIGHQRGKPGQQRRGAERRSVSSRTSTASVSGALGSFLQGAFGVRRGRDRQGQGLTEGRAKAAGCRHRQEREEDLGQPGLPRDVGARAASPHRSERGHRDLELTDRRADPRSCRSRWARPATGPSKGMSKEKLNELLKHMASSASRKPAASPAERTVKLALRCALFVSALLGSSAVGCDAMRGGANPEMPLWLRRPNFSMQPELFSAS